MAPVASQLIADFDHASRWWDTYPNMEYSSRAKPYQTYQSYISDVYAPVKRLWKSASAERLHSWDRGQEPYVQKASSVSSLSASHMQPLEDRVATRYVPLERIYKPKGSQWRQEYDLTLKHLPKPYTAPMYLPVFTGGDNFTDVYASKKFATPTKIHRPAYSQTRWQYSFQYEYNKLKGLDMMGPSMYKNYDNTVDDRPYMRTRYQVRSFDAPYDMRHYQGWYFAYNPRRVLAVW